MGAIAAFIFFPLALLSSAQSATPGAWQDFFILVAIWVTVKFGPSHWFWPYPGGRLAYIFTITLAVNIAIAGFLSSADQRHRLQHSVGRKLDLYILGALTVIAAASFR